MAFKIPHHFLQDLRSYADRITGKYTPLPFLLFDAGGTIVFPDVNLMIRQLARQGWHVKPDQLYDGYYNVIYKWDNRAGKQEQPIHFWPKGYAYELFDQLGVIDPNTSRLAQEIQKGHKRKNLWTFTYPWVRQTLAELRELGYRMAVLSNSDGRARQVIEELGLLKYFEKVLDSKDLKVEKPNPRIFRLALKELKLHPAEVIYIGDIYEVDVKGANSAGIAAVHIDPLKKYAGRPGVHIDDIRALPGWLAGLHGVLKEEKDLFPFPVRAVKSTRGQKGKEAALQPEPAI